MDDLVSLFETPLPRDFAADRSNGIVRSGDEDARGQEAASAFCSAVKALPPV